MNRMKTGYGRIWVCGVMVEEALREGDVTSLNPIARVVSRLCVKKMTGTVAGQWGPPLKTFSIYFELFWR
jgi:hypothetical protein